MAKKKKKNVKIRNQKDIDNYIASLMNIAFKTVDVLFLKLLKAILNELKEMYERHKDKENKMTWTEINRRKRMNKTLERIEKISSKAYSEIAKEIKESQENIYLEKHNASLYVYEMDSQKEIDFDIPSNKEIKKTLEQPIDKIKLNETLERHRKQLLENIRIHLAKGQVDGDGFAEVAIAIQSDKYQVEPREELYDHTKSYVENRISVSKNQALRVARTELGRAQSQAALDSAMVAKNNGLDMKKRWLATLDTRTRHTHRHLDGEVKSITENFKSNGCLGQAPHLFEGKNSAKENINCRCVLLFYIDDDELPTVRRARDENNKGIVIPFMTYREWEKQKRKGSA